MGLILSVKTDILKDEIQGNAIRPYSLARAQLMWWTLIILSCFTSYYGDNGVLQNLDESALILLGISIGTASAARIIDNTEISNEMIRHQNVDKSKGFLNNILSDNNGISIHRFQAFVFNLIFGFIFIAEFLKEENSFVDFGPMELGLMGISSAAYVGLKFSENNANTVQINKIERGIASEVANAQANFSEEELVDIDESYAIDRAEKNVWG